MTLVALTSVLCLQVSAHGEERLVRIGERRLSINCTGERSNNTTVVLMPGGGEPAKNWTKVQAQVSTFVHVCSYDPPGSGDSDKTTEPQSADEFIGDLHTLLDAAGEKKPYVLVAHSLAGILARRFATRFPDEAVGFVFVDSAHEEQAWRLHEIDPGGPPLSNKVARMGFFITPGERLAWRTETPVIVLARGKPFARTGQLTEEQFAKWDKIWARLQEDLATHSPKGQYRRATNSGHFINLDEPELVMQAIRDVLPNPPLVNGRRIDTILEPGKDWELLGQGFHLTADFTVDKDGNIYFTDSPRNRIYKIDRNGKIAVWKENSGGAHGVMFGPDDRLYLCQHDRKRIIAYAPDGKESFVAEGVQTHHLAVTNRNEVYFTEAPKHSIWFVDGRGNKRVVSSSIDWPRSVRLSPDQSLLVVDDPHRDSVWSFQIQPDGSLSNGQPFCRIQSDNSAGNDPGGMAFDTEGFLYIATPFGVQVCDQTGRVAGIINKPQGTESGLASVTFGGPNMQWLYVTDGDRMYRRQIRRHGTVPWNPAKPHKPH